MAWKSGRFRLLKADGAPGIPSDKATGSDFGSPFFFVGEETESRREMLSELLCPGFQLWKNVCTGPPNGQASWLGYFWGLSPEG